MYDIKVFEQWSKLYNCIDTAPTRYPVQDWKYHPAPHQKSFAPMDLWPIIKSQILLRCTHYFHTETGPGRVTISEAVRSKPTSPFIPAGSAITETYDVELREDHHWDLQDLRKRYPEIVTGRIARMWPQTKSSIVFLGAAICNYNIGDYKVQTHIDPLRIALENAGYKTATLLTDVEQDDPILREALLGGTFGIKEKFIEARNVYAKVPPFSFDKLPGFAELIDDIKAIFPIENILTKDIVSGAIAQTYSTYMIFRDYIRLSKLEAVCMYAYYGIAGNAISLACRENGIPFFDIQHGVAGNAHESYSWAGAPVDGYNTTPQHYLTWTDQEAADINDAITSSLPPAINVGHTWRLTEELIKLDASGVNLANFDRFTSAQKSYEAQAQKTQKFYAKASEQTKHILVCLYANEPAEWLPELISQAPKSWKFFLRLHPAELMDQNKVEMRINNLSDLDIEISYSSKSPIPLLMPHMDVVLNKFSSITRDAWAYNTPSVCYSLSSKWYNDPDKFEGILLSEPQPEAVIQSLEKAMRIKEDTTLSPSAMTIDQLSDALVSTIKAYASADK